MFIYVSICFNLTKLWDEGWIILLNLISDCLQDLARPKKSNLRSRFDISSQAVSNYPERVIFEWVCINIPLWIYSRAQHTLFCHLCHCELITGFLSLSDSISKTVEQRSTVFIFKSFHLHDFPSYLRSSISLSVYVFYQFISFSSQLCLYFGLPGPLSQGLPPFPFLVSLYTSIWLSSFISPLGFSPSLLFYPRVSLFFISAGHL